MDTESIRHHRTHWPHKSPFDLVYIRSGQVHAISLPSKERLSTGDIMVVVKSERANKLLREPRFYSEEKTPQMRRYPGDELKIWIEVEADPATVKKLSFSGELESWQRV